VPLPTPDEDDTFARTFVGIDRLRGKNHDDDWHEWKRVVLESLRAGKKLEDKVAALTIVVNDLKARSARHTAVAALADKVKGLEDHHAQRESTKAKLLGWIGKAALLILAALLGRISK
jgi:hypothetical protein